MAFKNFVGAIGDTLLTAGGLLWLTFLAIVAAALFVYG